MAASRQGWWQAADGRWYPSTSRPDHTWAQPPTHARVGCAGILLSLTAAVVLLVAGLGSGAGSVVLLAVPVLVVVAIVSFLRMVGRTLVAVSRISEAAWQEANLHAQERLADQLRFFEAQQRTARNAQAGASSNARPNPPGPPRNTAEWARGILGVRPAATQVEIRQAFRAASKRWHPDLFMQAGPVERADAEQHMEDINAAHDVLSGDARYGRVA